MLQKQTNLADKRRENLFTKTISSNCYFSYFVGFLMDFLNCRLNCLGQPLRFVCKHLMLLLMLMWQNFSQCMHFSVNVFVNCEVVCFFNFFYFKNKVAYSKHSKPLTVVNDCIISLVSALYNAFNSFGVFDSLCLKQKKK